jgi:hypothetical protein
MQQDNGYENIFDKGCLVQLSISVWGGAKKIDEEKAKKALGSEWAKARKALIDPEALKPIGKARNEARIYLRSRSLPFPINGVAFVPFESVQRIDEKLQEMEKGFDLACEAFYRVYGDLKTQAEGMLGGLFDADDYPADIKHFFGFNWRFITMNAPGENSYLSPELVAREQEKFINTMTEAREMGVAALREEFKSVLANCIDRLTPGADGKRKIFKDSLVGNFFEFFETFKERNIFADGELDKLCEQAKGVLSGVTPEGLRADEGLRETVKANMEKLSGVLENAIAVAPGRRLKIEE